MRGIVLAGGTGSRLGDVTKVVNKHLLPVGEKPMIYWPLEVLRLNCIADVTIVSTPRGVGQLSELLGRGYTYRVQDTPGGIADALMCARDTTQDDVIVILGDNVFQPAIGLPPAIAAGFAHCYLAEMPKSRLGEFGVPEFDDEGYIKCIDEKPEKPKSRYAVTGLYVFAHDVFKKIVHLRASARGEMEVTGLLNLYTKDTKLRHTIFEGFWGDAGTFQGIAECAAGIRHNSMWTSKQ